MDWWRALTGPGLVDPSPGIEIDVKKAAIRSKRASAKDVVSAYCTWVNLVEVSCRFDSREKIFMAHLNYY